MWGFWASVPAWLLASSTSFFFSVSVLGFRIPPRYFRTGVPFHWIGMPSLLCQLLEDSCHTDYILDHISGQWAYIINCQPPNPASAPTPTPTPHPRPPNPHPTPKPPPLICSLLSPFQWTVNATCGQMYRGGIRIRWMHAANTYGTRESHTFILVSSIPQ